MRVILLSALLFFLFLGCSAIVKANNSLPPPYVDVDGSAQVKKNTKITLLPLNNYTDTSQAGMRASNIIEGLLLSKGYIIKSHISIDKYDLQKAIELARQDGSDYLMYGGVSEWRYKTGIDGEAAVSIQCALVDIKTSLVVWSSIGSNSGWASSSIGETAQNLIKSMLFN
ncbi:MAG: hypothetical protein PHQ93_02655 [Sulfurimonas sp.]|uniref:hypothetical protein n=1 Tax=Sulfurimonas sp. TaxID=2022749 RepID=UPI002619E1C3|nr:hypothetical protein [Sulfurimonas sp.]MDD5400072.1 hypothetical protein [Sulfurimonas sp.]